MEVGNDFPKHANVNPTFQEAGRKGEKANSRSRNHMANPQRHGTSPVIGGLRNMFKETRN